MVIRETHPKKTLKDIYVVKQMKFTRKKTGNVSS